MATSNIRISSAGHLRGALAVPPDKSIAHRAYFFAALNRARTIIANPSTAADPNSTLGLLRALGYRFVQNAGSVEHIGAARSGHERELALDCGNSGTTARLAAGFLCGERGRFTLIGDESLSTRPMERVAAPLRTLGVAIETTGGGLPMTIDARNVPGVPGASSPLFEVGSAQVHGALFLAGLRTREGLLLLRRAAMRDHTLRMARAFGLQPGLREIEGRPVDEVLPATIECDVAITIPGDLSSAAFIAAAAVLVPDSDVLIEGVGLNPTRIAFFEVLRAMGADVTWEAADESFEPTGWIRARYSPHLEAVDIAGMADGAALVSAMMDELPLLALVASQAAGRTAVRGAAELRVKESDRIAATAGLLAALGIEMEECPDGFSVVGRQRVRGGAAVDHRGDHRLAMVAAVAGLVGAAPVTVPHPEVAAVSYAGFWEQLAQLAPSSVHRDMQ